MRFLDQLNLCILQNCSHSCNVNDVSSIWRVTRLYNPPLLLKTFLIIHEVALPQIIRTISLVQAAQSFQKCPSAFTKSDPRASIHGNSSMKSIFLPFILGNPLLDSTRVRSILNASNQFCGFPHLGNP